MKTLRPNARPIAANKSVSLFSKVRINSFALVVPGSLRDKIVSWSQFIALFRKNVLFGPPRGSLPKTTPGVDWRRLSLFARRRFCGPSLPYTYYRIVYYSERAMQSAGSIIYDNTTFQFVSESASRASNSRPTLWAQLGRTVEKTADQVGYELALGQAINPLPNPGGCSGFCPNRTSRDGPPLFRAQSAYQPSEGWERW